jgi:antitoxin MazE
MQVRKIGDEFAVMLSPDVVEKLGLADGDSVSVQLTNHGTLEVAKEPSVDELFARVRAISNRFPADFKFDRDDANRRGPDAE